MEGGTLMPSSGGRKIVFPDGIPTVRWEFDRDNDGTFESFMIETRVDIDLEYRCQGEFVGDSIRVDHVEMGSLLVY